MLMLISTLSWNGGQAKVGFSVFAAVNPDKALDLQAIVINATLSPFG